MPKAAQRRKTRKTAIAKLAANLDDIPLLFPSLKRIGRGLLSLASFIDLVIRLLRHR